MEDDLLFIRCTDEYNDEIDEIDREIISEKQITNLCIIDRKRTKLVVHNGTVVGFSTTVLTSGIPSIQYGVLKKYRNMGYGIAILNRLTNESFENGYDRVELLISPKNVPSKLMAEKCGFSVDYSISNVELNQNNENAMYITYYKNNYKKIR